jgi:TRAP-type C4-dicarboxylate transport system substrate-binding protein
VPPAHHLHKLLEGFAANVKQRTNGQVEVQLFASQALAKAGENFPQVAKGNIEAAVSVNFQWGNTLPEMNVFTIPFFFGELDKIKRFPNSEARKFLDDKLMQRGVKSVAWLYITRQSIFTSGKKELKNPQDFDGVKIRGLNPMVDSGLKAAGAAPSAMPGSEVYQALQSGVLDAGLTDVSAAYSRKYFEVQKYGTVTPFFTVYFHLYVNPAWWDKLSPAQRQAIEAAATKAEQEAIGVTESTAADAVGQLKEKGMTLHMQTSAEAAQWKAVMQQPVMDAFLKAAPEGGQKIIELVGKI